MNYTQEQLEQLEIENMPTTCDCGQGCYENEECCPW